MTIHSQHPEVVRIAQAAFPDYRGKKYRVKLFTGPMSLTSNWEGGSRDFYALIHLPSNRTQPVPENGTPFSNRATTEQVETLPTNCAVVRHTLFCGKDLGVTIFVGEENLAKLLPAPMELTPAQNIVQVATRSLISRARFDGAVSHTGIDRKAWDAAKAELVVKGLLKPNGAITDDGMNAAGEQQLYGLKFAA